MKAKDLAALLMKHPEAEVILDDEYSEYIYRATIMHENDTYIGLTWDLEAGNLIYVDGQLVEP